MQTNKYWSVIHDLNFFHEPSWVDPLPRRYYNYFFPRYIARANRLATVSEYSKKDISDRFNVDPALIDVLYNGVEQRFHPIAESVRQQVRLKYSNGVPYFLFLGLVHPRKNLTRIIKGWEWFRKSSGKSVKLMVVGSTKYWTDDTRLAYEKSPYKEDILLKGRLPEDELNHVIGSSFALVYASLFEGFGIPILEAMQCEIPVITSNVTSMPEVGGDAVSYVDPYSIQSIGETMLQLNTNRAYSEELVRKGKEQCKKFSWDQTAKRLWNSIEKIM